MTPRYDTTQYLNAHGRRPRGYALWSFSANRNGSWTTVGPRNSFEYRAARNLAIQEARALGCSTVVLEP